MSVPSKNYLSKVKRWIFAEDEIKLEQFLSRIDQQYRARLVLDAYHLWESHKTTDTRGLMRRLALRDYDNMLRQAELGNPDAKAVVEALKIRRDEQGKVIPRTDSEITNDIYVLNWMVGEFSTPQQNIHKAIYINNAQWLTTFGQNTGNVSAIKEAQRNLEVINDRFQEKENAADQMANTNINITGDVGVVKEGRESLSEEEKARLRKKYGLTEKEYAQEMEEIDGVWQPVEEDADKDFFEQMEAAQTQ